MILENLRVWCGLKPSPTPNAPSVIIIIYFSSSVSLCWWSQSEEQARLDETFLTFLSTEALLSQRTCLSVFKQNLRSLPARKFRSSQFVLDLVSFQKVFIDIIVIIQEVDRLTIRPVLPLQLVLTKQQIEDCAQYLRAKKQATPALIQTSSSSLLGSSMKRQKFVE